MRLSEIIKRISSIFERKRKNPIQLGNDSNLESNLKSIKVSNINTPLQVSEDAANIEGTLKIKNSLEITENEIDAKQDLTLDVNGDLILDPQSGITKFYLNGDTDDLCTLTVAANGKTTVATADSDGAAGHLVLDADGQIHVDSSGTVLFKTSGTDVFAFSGSTLRIYEDGGASTDDFFLMQVLANGAVRFDTNDNAGTDAFLSFGIDGYVLFNACPAGFLQFAPTYNASDTEVNFHTSGNKAFVTFGAGNITDMNINCPNTSSNLTLVIKQDGTGSRTVTNWKAFDSAGNAANGSATVRWAGSSAPTLSTGANAVDIISFYWDNTTEICYGVASLNFG